MKNVFVLGSVLAAAATVAAAPAINLLCCPNGVYNDDIAKACANGGTYGDGMCWNDMQINCAEFLTVGVETNIQYTSPGDPNLGDCFSFCQTYGGIFDAVNLEKGAQANQCTCLAGFGTPAPSGGSQVSLSYCATSGPFAQPPCCKQYDPCLSLDQACVGNQPGHGLCLENGYQILCNGSFATDAYLPARNTFEGCKEYCDENYPGWLAMEWIPFAPQYGCGCALAEINFYPNSVTELGYSLAKTGLQVCAPVKASCSTS
jgi:hypothetical protein